MQAIATQHKRDRAIDSRTFVALFIGGCAGMGFWEMFSSVPTAWLVGFPLQPPELVKSLFQHQLGLTISDVAANGLHFFTGLVGYPIGYFILTRFIVSRGMPLDGWVWGVITYFIALGFFAPLAGQSFLLRDVPLLSFMSLVGHAIYGYIAAYIFELLNKRS
jgi:small-conductance mechanosensitive channel